MKLFRISTIPMSLNILLKGQLKTLDKFYDVTAISSAGEDLDLVERREGVKTYSIEIQRKISPLKDLVALYKLYRYFKKEKPQIIHSITPKAGLLSMLAGKLARVPIRMHTFTGLIFPTKSGFIRTLLIKIDQLLCWAATNIYPEGNGVKNDLIKYKITTKPLKVLANGNVNGIDTVFFSPAQISEEDRGLLREQLNIRSSDFIFVFVGRLVGDKGINELVKAYAQIQNSTLERVIPTSKLLLVGPLESALDPLLPEILKEIEINANIISVGFQQDVRPYLSISNALVFPSYREGFPNVVMQAGAMGLPSIVTDINGCNEIIMESKNGVIIPVRDIKALRESMQKFMEDQDYYKQLKKNARSMIESRYKQNVVWDALLNEYCRILNS